jgi:hypothetical protein
VSMGSNSGDKRVVPSFERNGEADSASQMWTIVGTVSTIWSAIIALILAFLGNLRLWVGRNAGWFIPIILLSLFGLALILGYLLRDLRRGDQRQSLGALSSNRWANHRIHFTNINAILERESQARVIWVVTPRLFFDIYSPAFEEVISENMARNAVYRYIVPKSPEIRRRLNLYKEMYERTDDDERETFLILPESKFTAFLTELVIYDPGKPTMCAAAITEFSFSGPPTPENRPEDVIIFDRDISQEYARRFSDVWLVHKKKRP